MLNIIPLKALFWKEVTRFFKVFNQTIIAPTITTLLFLIIFQIAFGKNTINGIPYPLFLTPGLIMMSAIQNSFANTQSVIIMGKVMGTMVDYLIPPFKISELLIGIVGGGMTRGILVALISQLCVFLVFGVNTYHMDSYVITITYTLLSLLFAALFGLLAGLVSESFDQAAAITNYVITPMSFLSGTFYQKGALPEFWQMVSNFNPFFYMVSGSRCGIIGHCTEVHVYFGMFYLGLWSTLLTACIYFIFRTGMFIKH